MPRRVGLKTDNANRLAALNDERRAEYAALASIYDMRLMRDSGAVSLSDSAKEERERYHSELLDYISQRGEGAPVFASADDIPREFLPDFGNENADRDAAVEMMIYNGDGGYPAVLPLDEYGMVTHAQRLGLDPSAPLAQAEYLSADASYFYRVDRGGRPYNPIGPKFFSSPLSREGDDDYGTMLLRGYSRASEFESYAATRVVCKTNEYLRDHGVYMKLTDAQALRREIRMGDGVDVTAAYRELFDHEIEDGELELGRIERFLQDRGLAPKLADGEPTLSEYVAADRSFDLEEGLAAGYDACRANGMTPVDVFGYEPVALSGGRSMDRAVCDKALVHSFITGSEDGQRAMANRLYGEQGPGDEAPMEPFMISSRDVLMQAYNDRSDPGRLLHVRVSDDPDRYGVVDFRGETHAFQNAGNSGSIPGTYPTYVESGIAPSALGEDQAGYTVLRQYLPSDMASGFAFDTGRFRDAHRDAYMAAVGPNPGVPRETLEQRADARWLEQQKMAVANAAAICRELRENYNCDFQWTREGQIEATIPDRNLTVRVLDVEHPGMVGRVYGDNVASYIKPYGQSVRFDSNIVQNEAMGRMAPVADGAAEYIPTPEQAVLPLRNRLGVLTPQPGLEDRAVLEDGRRVTPMMAGAYVDGMPNTADGLVNYRVRTVKNGVAVSGPVVSHWHTTGSASRGSWTDQMVIGKLNGTVSVQKGDNVVRTSGLPIVVSSSRAGAAEDFTPVSPQYAYETRLNQLLTQAKHNFQTQVFGQLEDEIAALPADPAVSPRAEQFIDYLRDPLNDQIMTGDNGEALVREHEHAPEGEDPAFVMSDDLVVRSLQDSYRMYLEHDDAILQGVVDGRVQPETDEEFRRRIQASVEDESLRREFEGDENVERLMSALSDVIGDERYTRDEKLTHIRDHFLQYSEELFGGREDQLGPNGVHSVLRVNAEALKKYAGVSDSEVTRLMQAAGEYGDVRPIGADESYVLRMRERMVTFDENAVQNGDLTQQSTQTSPFKRHIALAVRDTLVVSGCKEESIHVYMDNNGILKYSGVRSESANGVIDRNDTGATLHTGVVTGYIGQIAEPDANGVIITPYQTTDEEEGEEVGRGNRAISPRYTAVVVPGEGSALDRMKFYSYEDRMVAAVQAGVRTQMLKATTSGTGCDVDKLATTQLNSLYRQEDGVKRAPDYMLQLENKGLTREQALRQVQTEVNSYRLPSSFRAANLSAEIDAQKAAFVDDRNCDCLSLMGGRTADVAQHDQHKIDRYAHSGASSQGLTGAFVEGAQVDRETRRLVASPDGETRCPAMNGGEFRYADNNPFDRNQMAFSNLMHSRYVEDDVYGAHMTCGAWGMDDAYTIDKTFAYSHCIKCEDPEASRTSPVEAFDMTATPTEYDAEADMHFRSMLGYKIPVDPTGDKSTAEQVRDFFVEQGVGVRPLMEGDKLCDFNGNKGVISRVVDRDMPDEEAERLGIKDIVDLYKLNPKLQFTAPPFSAVSRFNGGTIKAMMEDAQPLHLPDGREVSGGLGHLDLIISDNTADHKSHFYDEPSEGRRASGQLMWAVQSLECPELAQYFYGDNEANLRSVREKLLLTGVDLRAVDTEQGRNYQFTMGYEPHTLQNGLTEERPVMSLDEDLLQVRVGRTGKFEADGNATKAAAADLYNKMLTSGGFVEVPFEVKMRTGEPAPETEPGSGKYLVPVLPVEYRMESQLTEEGSSTIQNYNHYYRELATRIAEYSAQGKALEAAGGDVSKTAGAGSVAKQAESAAKAQKCLDGMADEVLEREFSGKYNAWKSKVMSHRLDNSATCVITPDPRLDLHEFAIDQKRAEAMGIRDGDPVVVWRDPIVRENGIQTMVARYRDPAEAGRYDISINPAADKTYDGDFDGDTMAVVSLRTCPIEVTNAMKAHEETGAWPDAKTERMCGRYWEAYEADEQRLQAVNARLDFRTRLIDASASAVAPRKEDDIALSINTGLDVASGSAVMRQRGNMYYDEQVSACKQALIAGDKDAAYVHLNAGVKAAQRAALGSAVMNYESVETVAESLNTIVVEQKAKGKLDNAKTLFKFLDGEAATKTDEAGVEHLDTKGCRLYEGEMSKSWTHDVDESKLTPEQRTVRAQYVRDMEELYSGSVNCVSIKAEGTGRFGAFSQKMANGLRDVTTPGPDGRPVPALKNALQMTYCGTQANLQGKHDVLAAEGRFKCVEVLTRLYQGYDVAPDPKTGVWREVRDENGRNVRLTKDQWVGRYEQLCQSKTGLNVELHPDRIKAVADALWSGPVGRDGKPTMIKMYAADTGSTLDNLAYCTKGGPDATMEKLKSFAQDGRLLFDTPMTRQFIPEGDIARETMKVRTVDTSASYSVEESVQRKADRQAERDSKLAAAFNEAQKGPETRAPEAKAVEAPVPDVKAPEARTEPEQPVTRAPSGDNPFMSAEAFESFMKARSAQAEVDKALETSAACAEKKAQQEAETRKNGDLGET